MHLRLVRRHYWWLLLGQSGLDHERIVSCRREPWFWFQLARLRCGLWRTLVWRCGGCFHCSRFFKRLRRRLLKKGLGVVYCFHRQRCRHYVDRFQHDLRLHWHQESYRSCHRLLLRLRNLLHPLWYHHYHRRLQIQTIRTALRPLIASYLCPCWQGSRSHRCLDLRKGRSPLARPLDHPVALLLLLLWRWFWHGRRQAPGRHVKKDGRKERKGFH